MQDSSATAAFQATSPRFPEQEQNLRCPRCESTNTKFCYYNNYNLSQPRHFCKSCRRYWTKGGALRNIPIGGGTRKNSKRSSSAATSNSKRSNPHRPSPVLSKTAETLSVLDPDRQLLNMEGSFSSLLACDRQLDALLGTWMPSSVNSASGVHGMELQTLAAWNRSNGDAMMPAGESYEGFEGDSGCWTAGWTDLAIYNPNASMQWK